MGVIFCQNHPLTLPLLIVPIHFIAEWLLKDVPTLLTFQSEYPYEASPIFQRFFWTASDAQNIKQRTCFEFKKHEVMSCLKRLQDTLFVYCSASVQQWLRLKWSNIRLLLPILVIFSRKRSAAFYNTSRILCKFYYIEIPAYKIWPHLVNKKRRKEQRRSKTS